MPGSYRNCGRGVRQIDDRCWLRRNSAAKIATARFYGDHILARVASLRDTILHGGESVTAMPLEAF